MADLEDHPDGVCRTDEQIALLRVAADMSNSDDRQRAGMLLELANPRDTPCPPCRDRYRRVATVILAN